jgi:hypothetical protein
MKRLLLFLLVACATPEEMESRKDEQYSKRQRTVISELEYYQDVRTGLCFAAYDPGVHWGLFTEVPCSDKVKGLIK